MQTINLTSHFLIAMPAMSDPNFSRTLTFVCEHNERGALGIVVNRPIEVTLAALFRQVEIALPDVGLAAQPVFFGGPVQFDHGFVLHRPVGAWKSTLPVGDVGLTIGVGGAVGVIEEASDAARLAAIDRLQAEWRPAAFIVGQPRHSDGSEHAIARRAARFARRLAARYRLPVMLVDETLTSVE